MISGSIRENREEERTLTEPSPKIVAVPAIPVEQAVIVAQAIPAEPTLAAEPVQATGKGRDASIRAEKPVSVVEEAEKTEIAQEAVPERIEAAEAKLEAEPVVEPEIAETPETEAVQEAVPEPMEAAESESVSEPVVVPEVEETPETKVVNEVAEEPVEEPEPVIEAEPEAAAEPDSAPDIEPVAPVVEPEVAPEPDSAPDIEPVAPVAEPPLEAEPSAAAEPEPPSEPVTVPVPDANAVPQRALKPQPSAEEKEAARLAARQKKLDEGSEESPFSVIVGQVYDGPMDLLLDLIRKQDINIYDIPIAIITSQFLAYVNQLKASDVDVAGDFIYTASLLIHIKSKMLLPHS